MATRTADSRWARRRRHFFSVLPHDPPDNTPDERRRWALLMLAGWMTMLGALLAATALLDSGLLLAEMTAAVLLAAPVVWRLHFSRMTRMWPNLIAFLAAVVLGILHWRMGFFTAGEDISRLELSYRTLVGLFYWVMAFRAFSIRTVRDLTQTALPAISGLLLVLIAAPTVVAITGTALVFAGTLIMLAGEHSSNRMEHVDQVIAPKPTRRRAWRPAVNSWVSLLLAAMMAAVILAGVAARVEPSNPVGQWLRMQLAWRLARLMIREPVYPHMSVRSLLLGGSAPTPRDRLMLTVESEEPLKVRTTVYDLYTGSSWRRSERDWRRVDATGITWELPPPETFGLSAAVTEEMQVRLTPGFGFLGVLPVPWCPQEITLDLPSLRVDQSGVLTFSGHLLPGDSYTAVVASPAALTPPPGAEPPPRVDLQHALQVPEDLPERVRALAREIAAEAGNDPTQIAIAMEGHLRLEYEYDLEAPPVPDKQDFIDHFLFGSRRGWCNHYATAMVVMLRVVGVPARLATGFTSGEFVAARGVWEIRDQDAHAWAEVFLPGTGWVDFDPTPALDEADEGAAGALNEIADGLVLMLGEGWAWLRANLLAAVLMLILLAAATTGAIAGLRWYQRRLRPLRPGAGPAVRILYAYAQMLRWLEREGLSKPAQVAPWEFQRRAAAELPDLAAYAAAVTGAYVRTRFGPGEPSEAVADETEQALAGLRDLIFTPKPREVTSANA
ncbi:MAG: transglutaminase domain-containing protein [candidate division WS1 bacterium]|nr:transglutaminase domain-containing protein [candidate division WS1 bacterium]